MADTTFVNGTVITADWLNAINRFVYDFPIITSIAGADPTGVEDSTAAFNAAFAAARLTGAIVVPPNGSYNFEGSLDPAKVCLMGPGIFDRETTDYEAFGVVFKHNGSVPLFVPSEGGIRISGILFYDPNQDGLGATPEVRPALIKPTAPTRLIDVSFDNNIVVNSYRTFEIPTGSLAGDWRVHHNRIYAVQYVFLLNANCPESILVDNNFFTHGVYQTVAVDVNSGMLAKWTANNGIIYAVDVAGSSVDGVKAVNNLYYGYRYGWAVTNGNLNVSTSTGDTYDKVGTVMEATGSSAIAGFKFSGCFGWCVRYGNAAAADRSVNFSTSGDIDVDLGDFYFNFCSGSGIVDDGSGNSNIKHQGRFGPWGQATGLTGDSYAYSVNNPLSRMDICSGEVKTNYADGIGVYINSATRVKINGVAFASCKLPIQLDAGLVVGAVVLITSCTSQFTTATKSVDVDGAVDPSIYKQTGCLFDQPSDITPSA